MRLDLPPTCQRGNMSIVVEYRVDILQKRDIILFRLCMRRQEIAQRTVVQRDGMSDGFGFEWL
jgi:hypothetical protein